MVLDESFVGLVGRWTDAQLGVIFQPSIQPLSYRVPTCFGEVQCGTFFDSCLEFLLHFRLGPAQDIFVNRLPRLRVMACCVSSLPAAILSLSDIAFSVCSSFRHVRHLLWDYTHYHILAGIATGLRESYQKIFILL